MALQFRAVDRAGTAAPSLCEGETGGGRRISAWGPRIIKVEPLVAAGQRRGVALAQRGTVDLPIDSLSTRRAQHAGEGVDAPDVSSWAPSILAAAPRLGGTLRFIDVSLLCVQGSLESAAPPSLGAIIARETNPSIGWLDGFAT
jgi:hypothetical protein